MKKLFSILLVLTLVLSLAIPAMAAGKTTVTLSHTGTVTLTLGQSITITATVNPSAPVTWTTKKAKVATVNENGKVTAVGEGTTTIVAKAGGKSAKVKIKVVDPNKPTKITFNQGKAVTAYVGTPLQLGTTLEPAGAKATLTWTSSKTKVATVDASGKVTPVAEGKAKITVTTHNKKKAKITVTVVDPNKPSGVTLSQGKTATLTAGQSLQLTPIVAPTTAKATLTFKSSKTKVAIVDANGKVTAIGKGKAKITVQDANYKKVKATITITVNAGGSTGGKDLAAYIGGRGTAVVRDFKVKQRWNLLNGSGFGFGFFGPETTPLSEAVITSCFLEKKNGYTIFGLTVGMTCAEVDAKLKAMNWKYLGIEYDAEDNAFHYYELNSSKYAAFWVYFNNSNVATRLQYDTTK